MANDEKTKLLTEATQLLADIALNKSGFTSEHAQRAADFIAKASKASNGEVVLPLAA